MCQPCLDAFKKHWPDLTGKERVDLLLGATSYPASPDIAARLEYLAKWTGNDIEKALDLAALEMDFTVVNNWRYLWPSQFDGMSDFKFFEFGHV